MARKTKDKSEKVKTVAITLLPATIEQISRKAEEQKRSFSQTLRILLEDALEKDSLPKAA